jgi:hypothetical protein
MMISVGKTYMTKAGNKAKDYTRFRVTFEEVVE